jgi:hypothetical protein
MVVTMPVFIAGHSGLRNRTKILLKNRSKEVISSEYYSSEEIQNLSPSNLTGHYCLKKNFFNTTYCLKNREIKAIARKVF